MRAFALRASVWQKALCSWCAHDTPDIPQRRRRRHNADNLHRPHTIQPPTPSPRPVAYSPGRAAEAAKHKTSPTPARSESCAQPLSLPACQHRSRQHRTRNVSFRAAAAATAAATVASNLKGISTPLTHVHVRAYAFKPTPCRPTYLCWLLCCSPAPRTRGA